jgi:hypothetical protein
MMAAAQWFTTNEFLFAAHPYTTTINVQSRPGSEISTRPGSEISRNQINIHTVSNYSKDTCITNIRQIRTEVF